MKTFIEVCFILIKLIRECVVFTNAYIPNRQKWCSLFGHRYPRLVFTEDVLDAQFGIPDTEAGCKYCKKSKPNPVLFRWEDIDYNLTTHRKLPQLVR